MGHYNNFINRTITLFEELTGEKPEAILIGSWDFKIYSHSLEYEKEIQGVPIEKEDTASSVRFFESSSTVKFEFALTVTFTSLSKSKEAVPSFIFLQICSKAFRIGISYPVFKTNFI